MLFLNNTRMILLLICFLLLGFFSPFDVSAAEKNDKSAKRAAILMQKMQQDLQAQMVQEKATLTAQFEAEKKALTEKIEAQENTIKRLSAAEGKVHNLEVEQKKISAEKSTLDTKQQQTFSQLESTNQSLADLKEQYAVASNALKVNESQRKTQLVNISQTTKKLETCEEKNAKLYVFGTELIHIYEAPNGLATLKNKSDFFKSKDIELENILQNQKDKLDAERLSLSN